MKQLSLLRVVNITQNQAQQLAQFLVDKQIQYEFTFCERNPEQIVKNLFDNVNKMDLERSQHEDTGVIHTPIARSTRHVQGNRR